MNKIETLKKNVFLNNKLYCPKVYLTAWDKWCISYINVVDNFDKLCSVCVEPENEPRKIEDTINYGLNSYIGNARTLDDAVDMIKKYINKHV